MYSMGNSPDLWRTKNVGVNKEREGKEGRGRASGEVLCREDGQAGNKKLRAPRYKLRIRLDCVRITAMLLIDAHAVDRCTHAAKA